MSYEVTLEGTGYQFTHSPDESLLDSALAHGLPVNYGCSNGNCGDCKAQLLHGKTRAFRHSDYVFNQAEKQSGCILMCTHKAESDLVIRAILAGSEQDIDVQSIDVRVKKVADLGFGFRELIVQTPRSHRLRFLAGQEAELSRDSDHCRLPIASCPCDDRNIQFHIPVEDMCSKAEAILALKPGTRLQLRAPYGNFVLNRDTRRRRIMFGNGMGLAPLKSIVEHSVSLHSEVPVEVKILADGGKHYLHNLLRSWQDAFDNLDYECWDRDSLKEHLEGLTTREAEWYVACDEPEQSVIIESLKELGVSGESVYKRV